MQVLIPEHSLLQGISQQPKHLRKQGQVHDMLNMQPDVVRGLRRRNGTELVTTRAGWLSFDVVKPITMAGLELILAHNTKYGLITLYSLRGTPIATSSTLDQMYLQGAREDFDYTVYNESLIVLNRKKVIERRPLLSNQMHYLKLEREGMFRPIFGSRSLGRDAITRPTSFFFAKSSDTHLSWSATIVKDYVLCEEEGDEIRVAIKQAVYNVTVQNGSGTETAETLIASSYRMRLGSLVINKNDHDVFQQEDVYSLYRQQRVVWEYIRTLSHAMYQQPFVLELFNPLSPDKPIRYVLVSDWSDTIRGHDATMPINGERQLNSEERIRLTRGTIISAQGLVIALSESVGNMHGARLGVSTEDPNTPAPPAPEPERDPRVRGIARALFGKQLRERQREGIQNAIKDRELLAKQTLERLQQQLENSPAVGTLNRLLEQTKSADIYTAMYAQVVGNVYQIGANDSGADWFVVPSLYTNLSANFGVASGSAYRPTLKAVEDLPSKLMAGITLGIGNINPEYYEYRLSTSTWEESTPYPQILSNMPLVLEFQLDPEYYQELQSNPTTELGMQQRKPTDPDPDPMEKVFSAVELKRKDGYTMQAVGDTKSNPDPSFVDNVLNGVGVYQGRLVLLSSDGVFMSQTNAPRQFYRESVKDVQDTDPISLYNPAAAGIWRYAVEFNQDLYVFSRTVQGIIRGRQGLTNKNAALLFNSSSPCFDVQPIVQGTTLLYSAADKYLDISQMLVGAVADTASTPLSITQHVPNLGDVAAMYSQNSAGILVCIQKDSPDVLMQFSIKDGTQYLQNAWGKWNFMPSTHSAWALKVLFPVFLSDCIYWYCKNDVHEVVILKQAYPAEETLPADCLSVKKEPNLDLQELDVAPMDKPYARLFKSYVTLHSPTVKAGDDLLMQAEAGARWVQAIVNTDSASEFTYEVQGVQHNAKYRVSSQQYMHQTYRTSRTVPLLIQGTSETTVKLQAEYAQYMTILGVANTVRTKQTIRQL
jgi:hypothetical protein|nr:MAG TPA: stabilization protein [Caudoviricetes sp.]